jgi:hypothetical protein
MYLEHVSYFAVRPLRQYFRKFNLFILDVSHNDYMGGSLRLTVGAGTETKKVEEYIHKEEGFKLFETTTYDTLRVRIDSFKKSLLSQLARAKEKGGKIIGVGAATKGNTLLNFCGIDASLLEFVTDSSLLKIGKFTPGSAIPIKSDDAITTDTTHALILPWNIADLLKKRLSPKYPNLAFIVPHMAESSHEA